MKKYFLILIFLLSSPAAKAALTFEVAAGVRPIAQASITDEDGDELETIGEIISKIGPDIKYINGGRRKKRTKKRRKSRRKSKGRKRRRKNLKKRTKRRR